MQVRGAPLLGVTAAYGMYVASKTTKNFSELEKAGEVLSQQDLQQLIYPGQ